jgi:glycerol-3-phosphate dehydrogenase
VSSRTRSSAGSQPTASRTPAACSSRRPGTTQSSATTSCAAARKTGVPVEEVPVAEALGKEPRLEPRITRAFAVPDANLDPWKLVSACTRSAKAYGATILPYHRVVGLELRDDRVVGARVQDELAGEELEIRAEVVINAAGAWAGQIAGTCRLRRDSAPRQGDHDRDEPPAREHGGQSL